MRLFSSLSKFLFSVYFIFSSVASLPAQSAINFLAPRSDIQQTGWQIALEEALSQSSSYRQRVLNLDKTIDKEDLLNILSEFSFLDIEERDAYLRLRAHLSWWLFHDNEIKQVLGESIREDVINILELADDTFSGQFQERFASFDDTRIIQWNEEDFTFAEDDESMFAFHFESAFENKEILSKWLLEKGRLAQALHVVHNIPIADIENAFRENKVSVAAYPQGYGEYKYVLKLKVLLNGTPYYLALKKIHASKDTQSDEDVRNEIAATNMNRNFGLPVIGAGSVEDRMWIDQFILGDDLDKFIVNLSLKYGLSENQIIPLWRDILNKAAKEFIFLFLRGFSGLYYVRDPHMGNIMAYWPKLHQNQIDPATLSADDIRLTLLDIGQLDAGFRSLADLPVNTVVVDVGQLNAVSSNAMFDFFMTTYNSIYVFSENKFKSLVFQKYEELAPTRSDFALEILGELNEQENILFVSALLQGLKPTIAKYKEAKKRLEIQGLSIEAENVQKLIKDLETLDYEIYFYVRTIVERLTKRSKTLKPNDPLPEELKKEWERASILSQKLNDLDLFDITNSYLKELSASAPSGSVRTLARTLYRKRTGENLEPQMKFTPPEWVTGVYL